MAAPMLIRFTDILDNRIEDMSRSFKQAAEEYGYQGKNFIIYPIKVNQMRPVVEEIINHGKSLILDWRLAQSQNFMQLLQVTR